MFKKECLFWNVDTQFDFMNQNGKLYVPGAEQILPFLEKLTSLAEIKQIQVVNTADHHYSDANELSDTPDFITTFPPHCMADSVGAAYVNETKPVNPTTLKWDKNYSDEEIDTILKYRNIIVLKDVFDVFTGNPNTIKMLGKLAPQRVFVYGVTTNVCVDCAVCGLANRNIQVYVITDAIKELPKIELPYEKWNALGVKRIRFSEIENYI